MAKRPRRKQPDDQPRPKRHVSAGEYLSGPNRRPEAAALIERLIALEILTMRIVEDFSDVKNAHDNQDLPDGWSYMDVPAAEKDEAKRSALMIARLDALKGRPFENTLRRWWQTRDRLAWEVLDWRDELHAVRGLLPSVAHLMDDPKEIAANHWTTRLRTLLGALGGAIPISGPPLPPLSDGALTGELTSFGRQLERFTDELKAIGPAAPPKTPERALRFATLAPLSDALAKLKVRTRRMVEAVRCMKDRWERPVEDRFLEGLHYSVPAADHKPFAVAGEAVSEQRAHLAWDDGEGCSLAARRTYTLLLRHWSRDLDGFHLAWREWKHWLLETRQQLKSAQHELDVALAHKRGIPSVLLTLAIDSLDRALPYDPDMQHTDIPPPDVLDDKAIQAAWKRIWVLWRDVWSASRMEAARDSGRLSQPQEVSAEAKGLGTADSDRSNGYEPPPAPAQAPRLPITEDHLKILRLWHKQEARAFKVSQLSAKGPIRSRETVGKLCAQLAVTRYLHRPLGRNKGYALTPEGDAFLKTI